MPEAVSHAWKCPECGRVYLSPLRVSGVSCGEKSKHKSGKSVEMKPANAK